MPGASMTSPEAVLVNLDLYAVALCNQGANSRAHILLTKGKETDSMPKTFEELMKALTADQAEVINQHIAAEIAKKDAAIQDLQKQIADLTGEVTALKKSAPTKTEEDVMKNASPEVRAAFEKLQATVSALVAERNEELAKARFAKVKAIPVDEAKLKDVLKAASPATMEVLESAAAAIEAGLTAKGKQADGAPVGGSADASYAKLAKAAEAIRKEQPELTFEQAFTRACELDPTTYKSYSEGVR
jgi:hypothetical protein